MKIFDRMASSEYNEALIDLSKDNESSALGYPELCQSAYNRLYGEDLSREFFTPNNILASQYIKALCLHLCMGGNKGGRDGRKRMRNL